MCTAYDDHPDLRDLDARVLVDSGTKYSIVVHVGSYQRIRPSLLTVYQPQGQMRFHRQKYSRGRTESHTLGKVAKQIAEVVEEYIDKVCRLISIIVFISLIYLALVESPKGHQGSRLSTWAWLY